MKLALALCMAILAVVLVQAEEELSPPIRRAGTRFIPSTPAMPRQFPYMAYIRSNRPNATIRCGGSLITRAAVLTEAHCILNFTDFTVRLGSIYRTANDSNAWTVSSIWAIWHPEYTEKNYYSNIGIIFLPKKAPLNGYIQPVELPRSADVGTFMGCDGFVSGWGKVHPDGNLSQELRWGKMIVMPNRVCEYFFSKNHVTSRHMCVGSQASKIHYGDYGAPLVLKRKERYLQIGLFSEPSSHYNTSKPLLFTRVSSFLEWIRVNTVTNPAKKD